MTIRRGSLWVLLASLVAGCSSSGGDDDDGSADDAAAGEDAADPDVSPEDAAGDGGEDAADVPAGPPSFTRHVVDDALLGPAFAAAADFTGDGRPELVISAFGTMGLAVPSGEVRIYERGAGWDEWWSTTVVPTDAGIEFPNHPNPADVDGDGDLDVIVPSGFLACEASMGPPCGALSWFAQEGGGWERRVVVADGSRLFFHHAEHVDIDGDGIADLVTVGERKPMVGASEAVAQWFRGTGGGEFEPDARVIGPGLGSLPTVRDVDGDGDLDVASAEFFVDGGSFAWYERHADPSPAEPAGVWERHAIDADVGPSIQLSFVEDLYGDGAVRAIGSNHVNTAKIPPDPWESAVFVFDVGAPPWEPWPRTAISTGIVSDPGSLLAPMAAPGIFGTGDIDGDGDVDVLLSGDGDPRVLWLEQRPGRAWETHVLAEGVRQAGAMLVVDLDGDGRNELVVSGYEANAVWVYVRD